MTQDQISVLLLKVGLISGFALIITWAVIYTRLSRGRNLSTPIGRSLMRFALLVAAMLVPFTLSLFFGLTRLDSRIVTWYDVTLIFAVSLEMITRILVWERESMKGRDRPAADAEQEAGGDLT